MQRLTGMVVMDGLIVALALDAAPASVSEADGAFPSIINLPTGQQPEGIAVGTGHTFTWDRWVMARSIAATCAPARAPFWCPVWQGGL